METISMNEIEGVTDLGRKLNILPGDIYRIKIHGTNPMDYYTIEGKLSLVNLEIKDNKFSLIDLVLTHGVEYATHSKPTAFEVMRVDCENSFGFGRITYKDKFMKNREEIKNGNYRG